MPPKPKFTRDEVIAAALEVVSRKGAEGLTAKELGDALGSSARPIFTLFKTMKEVQEETREAAMARFEGYEQERLKDMPPFKQAGMKMVLFGMKEPKLYQFLFMRENDGAATFEDVFGQLGHMAEECIKAIEEDYSLSSVEARLLFENMWIYTFGIGTLCATGVCGFSEERLSDMLSTQFSAMMGLIKSGGLQGK